MWNKSISLPVRELPIQVDEDGIQQERTWEFLGGIPANFLNATQNAEILANQEGYTADQIIEVMNCNYNGESFLMDEENGDLYDIKRHFRKDKSRKIQLTCQKRERGKGKS